MPVSLTKEEANSFLDSRPGWVVLTTIGKNGFPHSVPIGYFRQNDDIYLGGRSGTQRVRGRGFLRLNLCGSHHIIA